MYGCNLGCFKNIVRVTHLVVLQHIRNKKKETARVSFFQYTHGESNPNRRNRNPVFYPLNYGCLCFTYCKYCILQ